MSTISTRRPGVGAQRPAKRPAPALPAQMSVFRLLKGTPLLGVLFILFVLLPTDISFMVGEFRLTVYRVMLLLTLIPCAGMVFAGRRGRILPSDWLMLVYASWAVLALGIHHGFDVAYKTGGIFVVEAIGPYLLARTIFRRPEQVRSLAALLTLIVLILLAFSIPEAITGRHFLREFFAGLQGRGFSSRIDTRYGFHRAYGPFDHPILFGVFCASVFGLSWGALTRSDSIAPGRFIRSSAVVLTAMTSLSAGAMAALMTQFVIAGWERVTRSVPKRWLVLTGGFVFCYTAVDVLSNRTGMHVMLSYLTFSPGTAYGRMTIWTYGKAEVLRNPLFGIGLNDWVRPAWMLSGSVDNFWLLNAMRYGLPSGLAVLVASVLMVAAIGRTIPRHPLLVDRLLRFGWITSMIGLMVSAFTVHYWNSSFVYFTFFLGTGACLIGGQKGPAPVASRVRTKSGASPVRAKPVGMSAPTRKLDDEGSDR